MLTVLLSSLCTGGAVRESQLILDAYAIRCGAHSWSSRVTEEGVAAIKTALLANMSSETAVSCMRVDDSGASLMWIVGQRHRFLTNGACHVRSAEDDRIFESNRFDALQYLRGVASYAAIRHDLGKANKFFQRRLRGLAASDPIRHEILSLHLLDQRDANPKATFSHLYGQAFRVASQLDADSPFLPYPSTGREIGRWIMATHHRLPKGLIGCAYYENHLQDAPDPDHLREAAKPDGDPFLDKDLIRRLHETEQMPNLGEALFQHEIEGSFIWARLAMMLGDHYTSRLRLKDGVSHTSANSSRGTRPAQDLSQHLRAADKYADESFLVLRDIESQLPALYPEDRQILAQPSPSKTDYAWQNSLVIAAREMTRRPDFATSGVFVVMCASTGSGKTRAGSKVASALSGRRMRLTTLLGLRSLTLQTGDAYAAETGVSRENLATLIGSREVRNLHEAENRSKSTPQHEPSHVETIVQAGVGINLPPIVESKLWRDDDRRMLCSPVLVCTIDYLMGAADWSKVEHMLPQLRLLTSDILLDEIDGYNLEDYPAIGRLCYLAGVFGRKIILSSATAMPEVVSPLFKAYEAGWKAYAGLTGNDENINCLFAADGVAPVSLSSTETGEASSGKGHWFKSRYQRFTDAVARGASVRAPLRKGVVADVDVFPQALDVIKDLHQGNHVPSAVAKGVGVSCGLVRVARVSDAVALAKAFVDAGPRLLSEEGLFVQVVAYHANLPLAVRAWIESYLDRLLKRKPGSPDPVANQEISLTAQKLGAKSVAIIIVATPVEEVGRDHDFDWAFIEPSSSRSIAQCAGRVNRHRRKPLNADSYNVAIMRRNLRDLEGRKVSFWGPGFETKARPFESHDVSVIAPALVNRPDAEACLASKVLDHLPRWEREIIEETLEATICTQFIAPVSAKLTDEHFVKHAFRKGDDSTEVYFDLSDARFKNGITRDNVKFAPAFINPSKHWLIDPKTGIYTIAYDVALKLGMDPLEREFSEKYLRISLSEYYRDRRDKTRTHPIIGIFKDSVCSLLD